MNEEEQLNYSYEIKLYHIKHKLPNKDVTDEDLNDLRRGFEKRYIEIEYNDYEFVYSCKNYKMFEMATSIQPMDKANKKRLFGICARLNLVEFAKILYEEDFDDIYNAEMVDAENVKNVLSKMPVFPHHCRTNSCSNPSKLE
jgi:hypothetical protein